MKLYLRMQTVAFGLLMLLCPLTYAHEHIPTPLLTDPVQDGWRLKAIVNELEGGNVTSNVSEMDGRIITEMQSSPPIRKGNPFLNKDKFQLKNFEKEKPSHLYSAEEQCKSNVLKKCEEKTRVLPNQGIENDDEPSTNTESQNVHRIYALVKSSLLIKMPPELMLFRNPKASLTSTEGDNDRIESLTIAIQDRDKALAAAMKKADDSMKALEQLHTQEHLKDKKILDLQKALELRSCELKEASSTLADLRSKQNDHTPLFPGQKRAYVAGLMIAKGLSSRIEAWKQAGVNIDTSMFLSGLKDGLEHKVQQKVLDVKHEKMALIKSIQYGVARKVQEAQKQLILTAKGRSVIKSNNGITWYRIHAGKMIDNGKPVKLSMTENVLGGRIISRLPPLTIRPEDSLPTLVREGMYLPGSGGEVAAYGMARDIYGKLPLPTGVYPWTVMEYHLRGEDFTPR